MPLTIDWAVWVNGQNWTARFNPYVMEIEVTDGSGKDADQARITLADDGRIILPKKGAEIRIEIMGVTVFSGVLKTPRLTDAKGQGGRMVLQATGHDTEGPGKEGRQVAVKDGTLGEYLTKLGKAAGYTVKVDPELAKIKRTVWASEGRSFHHHAQQLADEYGGTLKLSGKKAVIAKRGGGNTPSGQQLPTIYATRGANLINVDIEPFDESEAYKDVRFTWFDRKKATFREEKADIRPGLTGSSAASAKPKGRASDKQDAKDRAKGKADESERDRGGGSVEIEIEPRAKAEGTCIVQGQREGADGTYRIESATHTLRGGGGASSTKLQLKQPEDKAGKDARKPGDTGEKKK